MWILSCPSTICWKTLSPIELFWHLCWEFAQLLKYVGLHLLSNFRSFQPLFPWVLFWSLPLSPSRILVTQMLDLLSLNYLQETVFQSIFSLLLGWVISIVLSTSLLILSSIVLLNLSTEVFLFFWLLYFLVLNFPLGSLYLLFLCRDFLFFPLFPVFL